MPGLKLVFVKKALTAIMLKAPEDASMKDSVGMDQINMDLG